MVVTDAFWRALVCVGVTAYLVLGFYTELQLVEQKPIPRMLLEDHLYYERALATALDGADPYQDRSLGTAYLYPPPALLVVELLALPKRLVGVGEGGSNAFLLQVALFWASNIALLVAMIYGVGRAYGLGLERIWFWLPLGLGFAPFLELLHIGQINLISSFGLFLLFVCETRLPWVAGAGLSLAILTKTSPVLFIGYLLARRSYSVLTTTAVALLFLSALTLMRIGIGSFVVYPGIVMDLLTQFPLGANSHSLIATLAGAGIEAEPQVAQRLLGLWLGACLLVSGIVTMLDKGREREPLFLLCCLAMAMSPNIMWYHHYVFLLLPAWIWMAWSGLRPAVVLWCCLGLTLMQIGRWFPPFGLPTHIWAQLSIVVILVQQLSLFARTGRLTVA